MNLKTRRSGFFFFSSFYFFLYGRFPLFSGSMWFTPYVWYALPGCGLLHISGGSNRWVWGEIVTSGVGGKNSEEPASVSLHRPWNSYEATIFCSQTSSTSASYSNSQNFTPIQNNMLTYKQYTQCAQHWKQYLACTNPIAISVAADLMERATLVRYCLNSVTHDWSSARNCGEWVYQTDAMRTLISAQSAMTSIVSVQQ